jgi:uncharacterized protein (TIGR02145 family)
MLRSLITFILKYYIYSFILLFVLYAIGLFFKNRNTSSTKNRTTSSESIIKDSTLTDQRDGQTYRIRQFDGLWWMIDNINIELGDSLYYKDVYIGRGSYYYDNDPKYGFKYGQLYDLSSALEACPNGWRLPSIREWEALNKKHGNCAWDNNSATGNYRNKMPSFEPVGGGDGSTRSLYFDDYKKKGKDAIRYHSIDNFTSYWCQVEHNRRSFAFQIDMNRCLTRRTGQGNTSIQIAQRQLYSCRCVQEAN